MTPDEYIQLVMRSAPAEYKYLHTIKLSEHVVHAAIGISTEAGELLDAVKKGIIYGKPFDDVNGDEEIGDLLWYIALYLWYRGKTFEEIMEQNIAKLRVRYPEQFDEKNAQVRDLEAERMTLEKFDKSSVKNLNTDDLNIYITRAYIAYTRNKPLPGVTFKYHDQQYTTTDGQTWTPVND